MESNEIPTTFFDRHPVVYSFWIALKLWFYLLCLFTATEVSQVVYQQF